MSSNPVGGVRRHWQAAKRTWCGSRAWLLAALALLPIPLPAAADEIPFFVTNQDFNPVNTCIQCYGPWLRQSSPCGSNLPVQRQRLQFYSAEINLFSPFGPVAMRAGGLWL